MRVVTPENQNDFYSGISPRDVPFFRVREAAQAIDGMPESTLRNWAKDEVFTPARADRPITLSFNNLVEARVVRALRVNHKVPLAEIRQAVAYAEDKLGIEQLLLRKDLTLDATRSILIGCLGQFVDLNPSSQLKMRFLLDQTVQRVEFDSDKLAERFYPRVAGSDQKVVYLDPLRHFGRAVVSTKAISTSVIQERYDLGETRDDLAEDYGILRSEIDQAILFQACA